MLSKITAGLEKDEQELMVSEFNKSVLFRQRIAELLEKDIESTFTSMLEETKDSQDDWSRKQLERVAKVKAMKKLLAMMK